MTNKPFAQKTWQWALLHSKQLPFMATLCPNTQNTQGGGGCTTLWSGASGTSCSNEIALPLHTRTHTHTHTHNTQGNMAMTGSLN